MQNGQAAEHCNIVQSQTKQVDLLRKFPAFRRSLLLVCSEQTCLTFDYSMRGQHVGRLEVYADSAERGGDQNRLIWEKFGRE